MRRPNKPTPLGIIDLTYNPKSGRYEITERGITYHLELEHTRKLKEFFKGIYKRGSGSIADWYNKLDIPTKRLVKRTGNIQTTNDFYPDQSFED